MSIRVQVSGYSRPPFRRFTFPREARRWVTEVGPVVREALKREAPVGKGPTAGKLRDSIDYTSRVGTNSAQMVFSTRVPYAKYVLDGTRPHVIRARNARALHWTDASGDRFARVVNHPGTRPNLFPTRAVRPLLPVIQRRFKEITQTSLRG